MIRILSTTSTWSCFSWSAQHSGLHLRVTRLRFGIMLLLLWVDVLQRCFSIRAPSRTGHATVTTRSPDL